MVRGLFKALGGREWESSKESFVIIASAFPSSSKMVFLHFICLSLVVFFFFLRGSFSAYTIFELGPAPLPRRKRRID